MYIYGRQTGCVSSSASSRQVVPLPQISWWPDGNMEKDIQEYQMTVHLFCAVSSPSCCNFALKQMAKDMESQRKPLVSETIDNKLSWQEHIKNICKSFSKKVAVLKRIKLLPKPILETIYYKTIIPSVLYGISVWGCCSSALMGDINRIHLRATRIIHNIPCNIPNDDIMNAPYWNSINLLLGLPYTEPES